jgi:hypothetical protein
LIIRQKDTKRKVVITEVQIQDAQEKINRWDSIMKMMETVGWGYLMDELEDEISQKDSFKGIDPNFNKMLIRKGYCDGLRKPLQIIEKIEKIATSASEVLRLGLAQNEE